LIRKKHSDEASWRTGQNAGEGARRLVVDEFDRLDRRETQLGEDTGFAMLVGRTAGSADRDPIEERLSLSRNVVLEDDTKHTLIVVQRKEKAASFMANEETKKALCRQTLNLFGRSFRFNHFRTSMRQII